MTILVDHLPVNITTGTQEFGPVNVPSSITHFKIGLARHTDATPTFWPNTETLINAQIFLSTDGGLTYPQGAGGMISHGGTAVFGGQQVPESSCQGTITAAAGRKAKAIVTVTSGPLLSQITVEVT